MLADKMMKLQRTMCTLQKYHDFGCKADGL